MFNHTSRILAALAFLTFGATIPVRAAGHRSWRLGEDDPGAANGTVAQAATHEAWSAKNLSLVGSAGTYSGDVPAGGSTLSLSLTGSSHYSTDDATIYRGVNLSNFQVSFDAKPTAAPGYHVAVCLGCYGSGCDVIYYTEGVWHYAINGQGDRITGTGTTGAWQNITFTRKAGVGCLYVNGALAGTHAGFVEPSSDFSIGSGKRSDGTPDGRFVGLIDNVKISDVPDPDSDGDGLPDSWETAHGLDPKDATGNNGATGDPDGDGFDNLAEFTASSRPDSALSTPISPGKTGNINARGDSDVASAFGGNLPLAVSRREQREVTLDSLLAEMSDMDSLARWPTPEYRGMQSTTYNHASTNRNQPEQNVGGWFADGDCGGHIRTETVNGKKEWVVVDHQGPGVVTRLQTPYFYYDWGNRIGARIKIYLDGASEPVVDALFIELVTNNNWPAHYDPPPKRQNELRVPEPIAAFTARSGNCFLPIPFAKSCRITWDAPVFYHYINYRAYAPDAKVKTVTREEIQQAQARIAAAAVKTEAGRAVETMVKPQSLALAAGQTQSITLASGAAAIKQISFEWDKAWLEQNSWALRSTILELEFDGETTVAAPLGDLFGCPARLYSYATLARLVTAEGLMQCRWRMPFAKRAVMRLKNLGEKPLQLTVGADTMPWRWDERSMHFHANWRSDRILPGHVFVDLNFAEIQGRGVLVGDQMTALNGEQGWWGEGDERIYVDGAWDKGFPDHFGIGTEDYYGTSGGVVPSRLDMFSNPFLAHINIGDPTNPIGARNCRGFNILARHRALDAIPFAKKLVFDFEASPGTTQRNSWNFIGYSSMTFWYGFPGARDARPLAEAPARAPVMSLADLDRRKQEAISFHHGKVVNGVQDFDRLLCTAPGLRIATEKGSPATLADLNGAYCLGIAMTKASDTARFTWQPATFGEHVMALVVVVSPDSGRVRFLVNGQAATEAGLRAEKDRVERIELGKFSPKDGKFTLDVEWLEAAPGKVRLDVVEAKR